MWGGDLNVLVDLNLIQNYYIDRTEDFFIQLQHDRTRFLEMKIFFCSPFSLLHILNNSCPLYQIYKKK